MLNLICTLLSLLFSPVGGAKVQVAISASGTQTFGDLLVADDSNRTMLDVGQPGSPMFCEDPRVLCNIKGLSLLPDEKGSPLYVLATNLEGLKVGDQLVGMRRAWREGINGKSMVDLTARRIKGLPPDTYFKFRASKRRDELYDFNHKSYNHVLIFVRRTAPTHSISPLLRATADALDLNKVDDFQAFDARLYHIITTMASYSDDPASFIKNVANQKGDGKITLMGFALQLEKDMKGKFKFKQLLPLLKKYQNDEAAASPESKGEQITSEQEFAESTTIYNADI